MSQGWSENRFLVDKQGLTGQVPKCALVTSLFAVDEHMLSY